MPVRRDGPARDHPVRGSQHFVDKVPVQLRVSLQRSAGGRMASAQLILDQAAQAGPAARPGPSSSRRPHRAPRRRRRPAARGSGRRSPSPCASRARDLRLEEGLDERCDSGSRIADPGRPGLAQSGDQGPERRPGTVEVGAVLAATDPRLDRRVEVEQGRHGKPASPCPRAAMKAPSRSAISSRTAARSPVPASAGRPGTGPARGPWLPADVDRLARGQRPGRPRPGSRS